MSPLKDLGSSWSAKLRKAITSGGFGNIRETKPRIRKLRIREAEKFRKLGNVDSEAAGSGNGKPRAFLNHVKPAS